MAPSMDCAVSSLLCAEDNTSILYDEDDFVVGYGFVEEVVEDRWDLRNHRNGQEEQRFYGDEYSLIGLPLQSKECLDLMIERECEHMPAGDYLERLRNGDLDIGVRVEILDWISKVHSHFNFGPMCAYLSVNYLDRFLSAYDIPKGQAWMMQLLGVACLSLAAKMEETEVPLSLDLQVGEAKFVFEAKTIQRMELLVLSTLKWRMQAVTPYSFIDYFLKKINGDQSASRYSIAKSVQLILSTLKGIHFLEFKPSEIAAAVAISVSVGSSEKAISALVQHVQKDRVMKCVELMQESSFLSDFVKGPTSASIPSVPQSPIGVLDAACLSYGTDDSGVGSCANSSHNSPVAKRRKLDKPYEFDA